MNFQFLNYQLKIKSLEIICQPEADPPWAEKLKIGN